MESDYLVEVLKSKLHRAEITGANVDYEGSLGISIDLMEAVGMLPYEKILCANQSNGARFETYAIPAPEGRGDIVLNGAAARLGEVGDLLTILSFARVAGGAVSDWKPRMAVLSNQNSTVEIRSLKREPVCDPAAAVLD